MSPRGDWGSRQEGDLWGGYNLERYNSDGEENSTHSNDDMEEMEDVSLAGMPPLITQREIDAMNDSDDLEMSGDEDEGPALRPAVLPTLNTTITLRGNNNGSFDDSDDDFSIPSSLPELEPFQQGIYTTTYVDDILDTTPTMLRQGDNRTIHSSHLTLNHHNNTFNNTLTHSDENLELEVFDDTPLSQPTNNNNDDIASFTDGAEPYRSIPQPYEVGDIEEHINSILESMDFAPIHCHDDYTDTEENLHEDTSAADEDDSILHQPTEGINFARIYPPSPTQGGQPSERTLTYEDIINRLNTTTQTTTSTIHLENNEDEANLKHDLTDALPLLRELETKKRRARGPNRSNQQRPTRVPTRFIPTTRPSSTNPNSSTYRHPNEFQQQLDRESERSISKIASLDLNTPRSRSFLQAWGDHLTTSNDWPNTTERRCLRFFHLNPNGISYFNNYMEWEMTLGFLNMMQVDIFGLSEVNLDLNKPSVRSDLRTHARSFDQFQKLEFSSSKQQVGPSPYKRGGTITGVNGVWSGRRLKTSGQEKLGRWSFLHLRGRRDTIVTIITTYRVCNQSNGGESTIALQQQRDLLEAKGRHCNPRNQLLDDLHVFIQELHDKGHVVILLGDMNESLNNDRSDVNVFLANTNLTNVMHLRHPGKTLPTTHDRGQHCIDLMAISTHVPAAAIEQAGYLPFYFNFASDHRASFFDINIDLLFSHVSQDNTRTSYRRFNTSMVNRCDRYLQRLEELFEESKVFSKVNKLEQQFLNILDYGDDSNLEECINETQQLSIRVSQFMINAERQCGPQPYEHGFPFSEALQEAGFQVYRCKKLMRLISLGLWDTTPEETELARQSYKDALTRLRDCQKHADVLRDKHVDTLAEKRAREWNMDQREALHIIRESEKSRLLHAKHKSYLKPPQNGTLNTILVPQPITGKRNNMFDTSTYTEVDNPEDIFDILLRRNARVLLQSRSSIFSRGPLLDMCGWFAESDGVEDLLQGTLNTTDISQHYPEFAREANAFLQALGRPVRRLHDGPNTFKWQYGVDEFIATFRKTRESTSCGPSGLHMSHWKAACERRQIARVHAFFIWSAMQFGFSYQRWEESWHCMIQKKADPIYPKLRIVQLFEGDFNAALKYLLGRVLMHHITKENVFDPEIFGSRQGKTASEALINLQVLYDHHRMWYKVLASLFNDADACYDRIPPNLSDICMQRQGCPKTVANCHTLVQKNMKHRIRISAGVSLGFIAFAVTESTQFNNSHVSSILGPTGGIGQGGGGGPIAWISVIMVMLLAYRSLCDGAPMEHGLQWISYVSWVISYVDDNTLVRNFPITHTPALVFEQLSENLNTWNKLLQITGGDLCLDKCEVSVMSWKFTEWGIPKLQSQREFPGTVEIASCLDKYNTKFQLLRKEPWEAERVLGVRLPMSGKMDVEYKFRLHQMKDFAQLVARAPLTPFDAFMVYQSRYCPMIKFPLPVTIFTEKECHNLQKPVIFQLLPKMGLNRHTPRALIYGPRRLGGRELMDLRIEQPVLHWQASLGHLRRRDRVGDGLLITAHDLQIIIGSQTNVFELDPSVYNYGPKNTRWGYFWDFLFRHQLTLKFFDTWTPPLRCERDSNLMDLAVHDPFYSGDQSWKLFHINQCRLYFQAFNISDLTDNGGSTISRALLHCEISPYPHPYIKFPPVRRPRWRQLELFLEFLFRKILYRGYRLQIGTLPAAYNIPTLWPRPTPETLIMKSLLSLRGTWSEIWDQVPASLQLLVGPLDMYEFTFPLLATSLINGTLTAATDGGFKSDTGMVFGGMPNNVGSHGIYLRNKYDITTQLSVSMRSPRSNNMSSLTTEHFGVIGLAVILHVLCAVFEITDQDRVPDLTLVIDNAQVSDRILTQPEPFNTGDYISPEMDLWLLQWQLLDNLPFFLRPHLLKSHQDTTPAGHRLIGPLSFPVMMNVEADYLASNSLHDIRLPIIPRPVYSTSVASLQHTLWNTTIGDLKSYLLHKDNGKILIEYLMKRREWTPMVLGTIDWEALDIFLAKVRPTRRGTLLKLMHDWQNTGRQKQKFMDAANITPSPALTATTKCPMGCGQHESHLHYMCCPTPTAQEARSQWIQHFLNHLRKYDTPQVLLSVINVSLRMYTDSVPHREINLANLPTTLQQHLLRAMDEQQAIGFHGLLQGYVSRFWAETYRLHLEYTGTFSASALLVWKKEFVGGLLNITEKGWKLRNQHLHDKDFAIHTHQQRSVLQEKIQHLYTFKNELVIQSDRNVFRKPLDYRLSQSLTHMTLWISLAEETLKLHRERATKNTLLRWLSNRPGPPR